MRKEISGYLKSFDKFGDSVEFKINGRTTFGTWTGSIVTLIIYILISIYGYKKFFIMWDYQDTINLIKHVAEEENRIYTTEDFQFEFFFSILKLELDGSENYL